MANLNDTIVTAAIVSVKVDPSKEKCATNVMDCASGRLRRRLANTPLLSPNAVRTVFCSLKRKKQDPGMESIAPQQANYQRRSWLRFPEAGVKNALFRELNQSWAHFLEEYGRGRMNMSRVERPMCFNDYGFMIPPEASNEHKRIAAMKRYCDRRQWQKRSKFDKILRSLLYEFKVSSVCVSVIDRTDFTIKYQVGSRQLPTVTGRNISLDGHAILSNGPMILLNAREDWRTTYNPFVHGPPFVRFYAAEALRTKDGLAIGAVSVSDEYFRSEIPQGLEERLKSVACEIMAFLDKERRPSSRIESASESSAGLLDEIDTASDMSSRYSGPSTQFPAKHGSQATSPDYLPQPTTLLCDSKSLRRLNSHKPHIQTYEILRDLMDCCDKSAAAKRATQILAETIALQPTYVLEVRVTKKFKVVGATNCKRIIKGTQTLDFDMNRDILQTPFHTEAVLTFVGGYHIDDSSAEFDRRVHVEALESEIGIQYSAPDGDVAYRAGIFMPMKKMGPKIVSVHRNKPEGQEEGDSVDDQNEVVVTSTETCGNNMMTTEELADNYALCVKTRMTGYVMAGFSTAQREFSPADVQYMKVCARALESIFECSLK